MKLSKESVQHLKSLLQTLLIPKSIDKAIIENGQIRAIDDAQTVVMISDVNIPDLGGSACGINRLQVLAGRLSLLDSDEIVVEAQTKDDVPGADITNFVIASKGAKFQFRCPRADMVKAPKKLLDPMLWAISLPTAAVKTAISAANTMDSEQIALCSKSNGKVFFEVTDSATHEVFTQDLTDKADWIPEDRDPEMQSFVHYYATKTLFPILKQLSSEENIMLAVGEDGHLQISVNNHTFTLLPRDNG